MDGTIEIVVRGSPAPLWPGILLLTVSVALLSLSVAQFRRRGGQWPVSALPCRCLVQSGLYAAWRHPIYLFYSLALVGAGLIWRSAGFLLFVMPIFAGAATALALTEERELTRRFGTHYANYKSRTGFVLPRFPHWLRLPAWILFRMFFTYRAIHKECVPAEPPFFVVSTHRDYLDPFFIALALPFPLRYVTTFQMFRKPVSAFIFRKLLCIPKKRHGPDMECLRQTLNAIDGGYAIGVFPEGERSWTGTPYPLRPEALKLLRKHAGVPILPVRVEGSYLAWPRWASIFRHAAVRVVFQEPIRLDPVETMAQCETRLMSAILPEDSAITCTSRRRARGLERVIYRCPVCRAFDSLQSAEGTKLRCGSCGLTLSVTSGCALRLRDGTEASIQAVYDGIRIAIDDTRLGSDAEMPLASSHQCVLFRQSGTRFRKVGVGSLVLTRDRLIWRGSPASYELPLSVIASVTVESNRMLVIAPGLHGVATDSGAPSQLVFPRESVLKWQDWLSETIRTSVGRHVRR